MFNSYIQYVQVWVLYYYRTGHAVVTDTNLL